MAASSGQQKAHEALADWLEMCGQELGLPYNDDEWDPLQVAAAWGNLDVVRYIIGTGADPNGGKHIERSFAVPKMTPIHIAARMNHAEVIKMLGVNGDVNRQDQWGFTPLHYATVNRNKQSVAVLLESGALVMLASKNGSTPLDVAKQLGFEDISDMLASKANLESDPMVPVFREWLVSLGAGEFVFSFLNAGYDLKFIQKQGLTPEDLDCVGIPLGRLGLRRKLQTLHDLEKFYTGEDEDGDDDEEGDDEDDDEEGEEDDEEEDEEEEEEDD
jgi:hypothetical protein